jgi:hypothetical protein
MEMADSTEMLVILYQSTRRHVPEDSDLYNQLPQKTSNLA